ncbi:ATP-binding cassette domain-containing protein [Rhizobium sp. AU243]|uniref:ABC transporter ATP-binding protein n=1 Tax=Rhizobium sp. AU243 TaxID=2303425 RepID=UPI0010CADEF5|nr:ATP-binding cassette domain-containing protein [Rhizobium sp. AU243]TKV70778.1 ATP-binding cassette domain-containing protein [Rhizobium sp. AU243]
MTKPLLEIRDLRINFGGLHALDGASFHINSGITTGLIGPNGAGKTTLFNCVSGLQPGARGAITFDGRDILGGAPEMISRAGLVRSFQLARGCENMTVFEHLMLYGPRQSGEGLLAAMLSGRKVEEEEEALREEALEMASHLKLAHVLDNLVTRLSGGQKKLLEIGRVLLAKPKMILLDEPMAGVNPTLVQEIADHLVDIRNSGISIVLIEHEMELIDRLCDEVIVMAGGRFLTRGTFNEVVTNRDVQESYLGVRRQ